MEDPACAGIVGGWPLAVVGCRMTVSRRLFIVNRFTTNDLRSTKSFRLSALSFRL